MYSMSCAPLTCCSIEAATDCDTTSALAPGKFAVTLTCGGTTCGYWEIGRPKAASTPTSTISTAMTVEKTGRSMKKLNMARALRFRGRGGGLHGRFRRRRDRLHRRAGAQLADAFHHHPLAGGEAARHHPVVVEAVAGQDLARLDLVAGADHVHRLQALQLLHGLLRNADRARAVVRGDDDAHEEARAQQALGIGHGDARLQRAVLRIDRGIDEVEPPRVRVIGAVGEPDAK